MVGIAVAPSFTGHSSDTVSRLCTMLHCSTSVAHGGRLVGVLFFGVFVSIIAERQFFAASVGGAVKSGASNVDGIEPLGRSVSSMFTYTAKGSMM